MKETKTLLTRQWLLLAACACMIFGAGSVSAQLAPNQTNGFGNGRLITFSYLQNFDCVDQPTMDLDFNGVKAQSDPNEMQTPICQAVTEPTADPAGGDIRHTAHLYVLIPMFSVDNDQNPADAMPCPDGGRPGELCGVALGKALIALFGAVPEAWKAKVNPAITTQCPDPNNPVPGTCTMHASSVDLSVTLAALGKTGPPTAPVFVPTPNPVADYLLCPQCENRFNKGGESWVLANAYRGVGSFPIQTALKGLQPIVKLQKAAVLDARQIPGIDLKQLVYFAASVFWRAGTHEWRKIDHYSRIDLGPYEEQLRLFLLGQAPFPKNAALWVNISGASQPQMGAVYPYSGRIKGTWQHRFTMPGLAFWLHSGCLPAEFRLAPNLDENLEREMAMLIRTAKPSPGLLKTA